MKKFVKSFLLAASALLLFAGCSNLSDATVSSSDSGNAVVKIGIEGVDNSSKSSRTINPTPYAPDAAPTTFGKITLKGESEKGNKMDETELEFSGSSATVTLSYDVWYLTMTAYSNDATPVPVLQGHKRADMKNGAEDTITFKLSAEGLTTEGGVNISGTIDDSTSAAKKYSAALYDLNTNTVIKDADGTDVSVADVNVTSTHGFEFVKAKINPGRYSFRIYFYNENGTAIGTWGDVVVIAPGRTTTKTKDLGDILYKAPDAPTALSAYLVDNSVSGNNYQVLIAWTDASYNEEYFELTIKDITDAANPVDYKIFGNTTDAADPHVSEVFWESSSRVDGTLAAGSNYCIVKLPFGKKFDISIKAVNFVDKSAAKDFDAASSAYVSTSTDFTAPANTPYGAEKINLMQIKYDLDGGVLKTSATTTKTGSLNEYEIFKGNPIALKTIETAGSTSYPQLSSNNHPFVEWKDSTGTAQTEVSEFGNVVFTASYNPNSTILYEIDDTYGDITVTATQGSDNVKNGTLTNKSGNIKIEWTDTHVTNVVVKVLQVTGNDITFEKAINGNNKSVNFNKTGEIPAGTHQVVVIVTKDDGKQYADTFYITKEI